MALQLKKLKFTSLLIAICIGVVTTQSHAAWQQPPILFGTDINDHEGLLGCDANGHAIILLNEYDILNAYYYSNGSWGSPIQLATDVSTSALAMNSPGQALATRTSFTAGIGSVDASFFDGSNWSNTTPSPIISTPGLIYQYTTVALNDNGEGLVIMQTFLPNNILFSEFSGGTWTAPALLTTVTATDFGQAQLAYSNDGTAVAAWVDGGDVIVSNYISGVWQAPVNLGAINSPGPSPRLGIDSNGNAIVLWLDAADNVVFSYWDTATWSASSNVSTSPGNQYTSLSMAPGGTAVAAWVDASNDGQSSSFNGSVWGAPAQFASGIGFYISALDVSVDDNGNALVVYSTDTPDQVESRLLPLGGSFGPVELVEDGSIPSSPNATYSCLSSNGMGFSLLVFNGGEGVGNYGSSTIPIPNPPNPLNVRGSVCKNKFASQSELVKTIKWSSSADPTVVEYYLRRNGSLIAIIPSSGPFVYQDHKRCKKGGDTYTVTAVDANGLEITSVSIKL